MSVFVHVCMGIYMYVKGHCGCIQMQCVHIQIYVYISGLSGFVRVCVCVYIYTYMYEQTSCVHAECVHTNAGIHVCVCILLSPTKWRKYESFRGNGLRGRRPERAMDRMDRPRTSIDEQMLSGRRAVVIV